MGKQIQKKKKTASPSTYSTLNYFLIFVIIDGTGPGQSRPMIPLSTGSHAIFKKARTHKGKKILESKEAKIVEN